MGRGGQRGRGGRGGPSRSSATKRGVLNGSLVPYGDAGPLNGRQNNSYHSPTFSLREEARNTELHHAWNSDLKLRHAKVNFVVAGELASEEPKEIIQELARNSKSETAAPGVQPEESMANMSLEDRLNEEASFPQRAVGIKDTLAMASKRNGAESRQTDLEADQDIFFTDVKGSPKPTNTDFSKPLLRRSLSLAYSDSSEEVIVFSGRNHLGAGAGETASHVGLSTPKSTSASEPRFFRSISRPTHPSNGLRATVVDDPPFPGMDQGPPRRPGIPRHVKPTTYSHDEKLANSNRVLEPKGNRQNKRRKRSSQKVEEDEIYADYIENMEYGDEITELVNGRVLLNRDLGGTDSEGWRDQSSDNEPIQLSGDGTGWESTDLQDLDDLSTSEEVQVIVDRVLSKRTRPSGVQYLVVWEGYTVDDARWIPSTSLSTASAHEQIRMFEAQLVETIEYSLDSDDSDDSATRDEKIAVDLRDELEDMKDQQDHLDRKKARMTDEQIARLLSKQEDFGLGSDELVLFDGAEEEGPTGWDDEMSSLPLCIWNQTMVRQKKNNKRQQQFPSASAFADVLEQDPYNGFDVMDHDRPSLRKKPKGRRGQLAVELSDSELENSIQTAWENDRSKKKVRKQEREELRAQGLLGKKGKIDIKAKYKEGMSWEDVKKEISMFLVSSKETLPLPPMNPHDRKRVHEIANIFNLKSKSIGGGKSRFPTLFKTSRTTNYDEDTLSGIEIQLNSRRFIHRSDKGRAQNPAKRPTTTRKGRGGGFASAGVSYRDGEVVGAAAPEIGSENKGRTMLEKMGWSTGTALGALNNKGIMQPVTHIVKTTKAGLGQDAELYGCCSV